jgi:hypothetical protein
MRLTSSIRNVRAGFTPEFPNLAIDEPGSGISVIIGTHVRLPPLARIIKPDDVGWVFHHSNDFLSHGFFVWPSNDPIGLYVITKIEVFMMFQQG